MKKINPINIYSVNAWMRQKTIAFDTNNDNYESFRDQKARNTLTKICHLIRYL